MSINAIPDEVFYDPNSWIDLAPDYDWDKLADTESLTVEQLEGGALRLSGEGATSLGNGVLEIDSNSAQSTGNGTVALDPKG